MSTLPENFLCILNVGHGNSSVFRSQGRVGIVDAGDKTELLEFLVSNKISNIDYVFISHSDKDHISGLIRILGIETLEIGKIYLNSDSLKTSKLWQDLVYEIQECERSGKLEFYVSMKEGDAFTLGDIGLSVLTPSSALAATGPGSKTRAGKSVTSNSISASIMLNCKSSRALLAADMDYVSLSESNPDSDFKADLLVYPHHGGKCGGNDIEFAKALLDRVSPKCIVFSIGRDKFENPKPEIVALILDTDPTIKILCTQLSKHCSENYPEIENVNDLRGRLSCAGNVLINLDEDLSITYNFHELNTFIDSFVPSPMCRICKTADGPSCC